jgi:hypothetical protein
MTIKTRTGEHPPGAADAIAAAAASDNRRWAVRRPQMAAATIVSDRFAVNQPCIIRDMSATGAKLEVVFEKSVISRSVPDTFRLVLKADRSEVDCEVAWRRGNFCGVRFLSALRPAIVKQAGKPQAKPVLGKR